MLARVLEFFNIGVIILLANKNAPTKYIYYTLSLTVFSVLFFIVAIFVKGSALLLSLFITILAFVVATFLAVKAIKSPFMDIDIPEGSRCLVCSSFIKKVEGVTALHVENRFLFFDSEEHLRRFLQNFEEYVKIRRLNLVVDDIKGAYKLDNEKWKSLDVSRIIETQTNNLKSLE